MTHSPVKKQMKRYFRKKLYRFFSALNNLNFSFIKPVLFCALGVLLIVIGCLLPTKSTPSDLNGTKYQSALASNVRTTALQSALTDTNSVDVVALFLPKNYTEVSEAELSSYLADAELYSMYLTGKELSYLAESTVSMQNSLRDTTLSLDGLDYSYHSLRLPLNRVTKLSFSDASQINEKQLYRVVSTEEIFTLFRYVSYRSQHLMKIQPKDCNGVELEDYEVELLSFLQQPLTLADAAAQTTYDAKMTDATAKSTATTSVTRLHGLNLITLLSHLNQTTLYFVLLSLLFVLLLWFCIPRIKRVRLWIRIHAIRRRKRATRPTVFQSYRRIGSGASGISKRHVA